jgi:hypothetical protein
MYKVVAARSRMTRAEDQHACKAMNGSTLRSAWCTWNARCQFRCARFDARLLWLAVLMLLMLLATLSMLGIDGTLGLPARCQLEPVLGFIAPAAAAAGLGIAG